MQEDYEAQNEEAADADDFDYEEAYEETSEKEDEAILTEDDIQE